MNQNPSHFHGSDLEKIAEKYRIPKESLVNFAANVNPLGLSGDVADKIAENLQLISSYPDREYTSLRKTIAAYCGVNMEHIIVGNGSSELIALLIEQCFPKKTLVLGPTYSEYERELSFSSSAIEFYNLRSENDFCLDVKDFADKLREGYDLLILCNPNNPTSSFIDNKTIEYLLECCKKHQTFVMIDETYVEFIPECAKVSSMSLVEKYDNLMVLRGVSKFFAAPGLRFGYGATSNLSFLEKMKNAQIPWSLNSIAAYAGELMLVDKPYILATKELIEKEKRQLLSELKKLSKVNVFPAYANFILLQILAKNLSAADVFLACLEEGLLIRDCSSFQNLDGEFLRFCIMNPGDNLRLLKIFAELLT